ncbi:hypothetical protein B0H11DRAFT_1991406 [Mycena galericulata]|nr:hypothetical protein B0H11DRAFT_1991406 [Mycena galericulata]
MVLTTLVVAGGGGPHARLVPCGVTRRLRPPFPLPACRRLHSIRIGVPGPPPPSYPRPTRPIQIQIQIQHPDLGTSICTHTAEPHPRGALCRNFYAPQSASPPPTPISKSRSRTRSPTPTSTRTGEPRVARAAPRYPSDGGHRCRQVRHGLSASARTYGEPTVGATLITNRRVRIGCGSREITCPGVGYRFMDEM